jgi:predicted ATPase/serine phosphatase RsbU (regulator of sigma subunit)/tRNA A-37 threonylcarbamoyl transferase component Bud32
MINIDGYQIKTLIYESVYSIVYRGIRQQDNQPIILKMLQQDDPSPQERTRYRQEYEIIRTLNLDGVIKAYGLEENEHRLIIILEDFGAISWRQAMQTIAPDTQQITPLFLLEFLPIAIQVADILGKVHAANVIHKDINPANIVFHPETKQTKLIDFGISTLLSRQNPTLKPPNVLEGTLTYLSPEQTGRMNRVLDYRTDFYSLGVTFYELLTGKLPFETIDPLDLVHCHIARQPPSPHQLNPALPLVLSDIVMKLMAKAAEDRYQSAWGLKTDLEHCLQQMQQQGDIPHFALARRDISDKFQIPQKLYGRESETAIMLAACDRVAGPGNGEGASELILIGGYSGIGKSVLVRELYKPITRSRGYFITGKFDQFQGNIPYAAIVDAFRGLMRQLLTEGEAQLSHWRDTLLTALGPNGRAIVDVIPEMELIIGPQPVLPVLAPTEAGNRFNLVFQNFIQAFCSGDRPLVLFLDDLQWVDAATLKLIELMLVDADTHHLLVIGAYRDNEVDAAHPLTLTVTQWQRRGAPIEYITLKPLGERDVTQLIADTLKTDLAAVQPLSQLVMQKTRGNPFFVNEFLRTLHAEHLLNFDREALSWQWDIQAIERMGITDNVVDLMIAKVQKLSDSAQVALRLAACVGAEFSLDSLAPICQTSTQKIFQDLKPAVQAGLIIPISDLDEQLLIHDYKFGHDRIQQAAYALIEPSQRQAVHLQIGRQWLHRWSTEGGAIAPQYLFDLVDHLNLGVEQVTQPEEKLQIAQLNLQAGEKAKTATAYPAALNYLQAGIDLLPADGWATHYELTLALYMNAMEVEYLSTHFDATKALGTVIINHAHSVVDRVAVYELIVQINMAQDEQATAIETGLQALELLGIPLVAAGPGNQVPVPTLAELDELPEMSNRAQLAGLRLLIAITPPVHHVKPELFPQVALTIINLCVEGGLSALAAYAYGIYGLFLSAVTKDIEAAYNSGKVALHLIEKYQAQDLKCKVYMLFGIFVCSCKEHARDTLTPLQSGISSGLEVGDIEYVSYCIMAYCGQILLSGEPLEVVEQNQTQYLDLLLKLKQEHSVAYTQIWRQLTLNLQGRSPHPQHLIGDAFDETTAIPYFHETHNHQSLFAAYVAKLILSHTFKQYDQAVEDAAHASQHIDAAFGQLLVAVHNFYQSLSLLAVYPNLNQTRQALALRQVQINQAVLQEWAIHAPMNFQHKYQLVAAETARVLDNPWQATEYYEQAIQGAIAHGYRQEAALAHELAAEFYLSRGLERMAQTHLQAAYDGYVRWQAWAKVEALCQQQHSETIPQCQAPSSAISSHPRVSSPTSNAVHTTNRPGTSLDLAAVTKASQAISGEIVLEKLLKTLMTLLLQNTGAQVGYLILAHQDQLLIEAQGAIDSEQVAVIESIPVAASSSIPQSIIQYVARTADIVVLKNASEAGNFANDPYIRQHQTKSVLCVPLLNQGKLISIVYLENNLSRGVFTPDRIEVIKVLSAQAAISIENARLYQTLEDKVRERTTQLAQANQEITTLNDRLKADNVRMSAELEVTKQLQQMILPKPAELKAIAGLDIVGYMEPADEVGGDYYDVLYADGVVTLGIGDVTGHGLESGILMLMTQTAVRTLHEMRETDPVRFLDTLNRTLYKNVLRMNIDRSLTLAVLNYSDGKVSISGQHEETLIVRAGGLVERIDTIDLGLPIALDENITDFIDRTLVYLQPGDGIVLYTDGITEAKNMDRAQYGLERLCAIVSQHWQQSAEDIKQAVIADVREFMNGQKQFDDISLLILKQIHLTQ